MISRTLSHDEQHSSITVSAGKVRLGTHASTNMKPLNMSSAEKKRRMDSFAIEFLSRAASLWQNCPGVVISPAPTSLQGAVGRQSPG